MNKKIWIINQYAVPVGESTRQIKLSKFLKQKGYDVTIVCGSKIHNTDKNLITNNEKYRFVEFQGARFLVIKSMDYVSNGVKRILASIKFQHDVMKYLKSADKPDIVISDFAGLFGNRFLKLKTKYKALFILDILDLWPETFVDFGYIKTKGITAPIAKILYAMEHKAYRIADYVIFSFEGGADYIKEKGWDTESGGDVDLKKIRYLNNGIDLDEVREERINNYYEDSDLDSDLFKAIYLGSIREANNVKAIVKGAEKLKEEGLQKIKILIYGDGNKREELENYCKEHNLDNIVFKGRLPIHYAPNVLHRGDVNIFNFEKVPLIRFGISPNKLFMYFASEKPILSTISPNYDLVKNENCGIVIDNDADSIANGLKLFASMPKEEYRVYCENAKRVAEKFDYKKLIDIITEMIDE